MPGFAPIGALPLAALPALGSAAAVNLDVLVTDFVRVASTLTPNARFGPTVFQGFVFTSSLAFHGAGIYVDINEGISLGFTGSGEFGTITEITEGLRVTNTTTLSRTSNAQLSEAFRLTTTADLARGLQAAVSEGFSLTHTLTVFYGVTMVERLVAGEALAVNQNLQAVALDVLTLVESLRQTWPMTLTDGVAIAQTDAQQRAIAALEQLRVGSTATAAGVFNLSIAQQAFRLRDSLGNFFGADVADGVGFGEALLARARAMAQITDQVAMSATIAPQLLVAVRVAEGVEIEPTDAINMLFRPTMLEGAEITAGYVAPDGSFTSWVMNTRTGAVTEYSDFVFNSFARLGNRYLGASEDGLYELLGDDDDGDEIIARIKGGYMQFGGTQLSRLKSAYIAARGEGQMILKIIDGDGSEYVYAVDTRNMRSTKVHMGKGQRSRYFAFELISAGQDFDLDTIEFVPLVVNRRV